MKIQGFALAMMAGLACSVATAQVQPEKKIAGGLRFGGYLNATYIEYNGVRYPVRPATTGPSDVPQTVYDNGVDGFPIPDGYFYGGSLPNWNVLDQVSFTPGPGSGSPVLLTSLVTNVAIRDTVPATCPACAPIPTALDQIDILVSVYDTLNPTGNPVTEAQIGATLRIGVAAPAAPGWTRGTIYLLNPIDLTTLPGGGLQTADDQIYVTHAYVTAAGTSPANAHPDATTGFAGFTAAQQTVGSSDLTYWRDANGSGAFDPGEERTFGGPPFADIALKFEGEVTGGGPPGACCLYNGTCSQVTAAGCAVLGGVFGGDNTPCGTCPGPYNEVGDAGDLPGTAQSVTGSGTLPGIIGTLGADDADMYRINVCNAATFVAATRNTGTTIDTQLWMFRTNGTGLVHNDDAPAGAPASMITTQFVGPAGNGEYYLAISEFDKDAVDSSSNDIWVDAPFNTERAPDGPGATNPIAGWVTDTSTAPSPVGGNYAIRFTGACFIGGATCYADCDNVGGLTANDFICFLQSYNQNQTYANCDGVGGLTANDFICFLQKYNEGCS